MLKKMILTTKSKYALIVVADIAQHAIESNPVPIRDICARQKISARYVEQICASLVKSEIIKSFKGPGGGYLLRMDSKDITAAMIVGAVGESVIMTSCRDNGTCKEDGKRCVIHNLLSGLGQCIENYLANIRVEDIISKEQKGWLVNEKDIEVK